MDQAYQITRNAKGSATRCGSPACRSSWGPTARTWARCSSFSSRSTERDRNADAIADELRQKLHAGIKDAKFLVLPAPPVRGLGMSGGFRIMVELRDNDDYALLQHRPTTSSSKATHTPG